MLIVCKICILASRPRKCHSHVRRTYIDSLVQLLDLKLFNEPEDAFEKAGA